MKNSSGEIWSWIFVYSSVPSSHIGPWSVANLSCPKAFTTKGLLFLKTWEKVCCLTGCVWIVGVHVYKWRLFLHLSPWRWLMVGSLFKDTFSVTRLYSVDDRISEWWNGKDLVGSMHGLIWRYYPGIRLEGLRETTKNVSQDSQSPGPRIAPGISWILSRSVNHSTTTFSCVSGEIFLAPGARSSQWSLDLAQQRLLP
jgi:hypothetical protein